MSRRPTKGGKKRIYSHGFPTRELDQKFCERWLVHFDKNRAYMEAGFKAYRKSIGTMSQKKIERFAEYLRPLQEAKARAVAQRLAIGQEDVLKAMAAKAVFDPGDFVERSTEQLFTEKIGKGKRVIRKPVFWNGQPVFEERLKPFSELTQAQRMSVEVISDAAGRIHYRLPGVQDQHQYLTSIGRQLGLFHEKLIMERHNHTHRHATLNLDGVPTEKLDQLVRMLLPMAGNEFAALLGFTAEEVQAAALEEGVIMTVPQKSKT